MDHATRFTSCVHSSLHYPQTKNMSCLSTICTSLLIYGFGIVKAPPTNCHIASHQVLRVAHNAMSLDSVYTQVEKNEDVTSRCPSTLVCQTQSC